MKKFLFLTMAACVCLNIPAQEKNAHKDQGSVFLKHWAIGANVGTNFLGVDLSTTLTHHLEMRVGYDVMSRFSTTTHLTAYGTSGGLGDGMKVDFLARSNMKTGKVLFDIFPSKKKGLHVTLGAFVASNEKVANAFNTSAQEDLQAVWDYNQSHQEQQLGVQIGDYFMTPNPQGLVYANFCVKRIQPYIGIGWGRTVPRKLLSFSMDLGVKIWGKPEIRVGEEEAVVPQEDIEKYDNKALTILSKMPVYPVINFRFAGKLF